MRKDQGPRQVSQARACRQMERVVERIKIDPYLELVDISMIFSGGGIADIGVTWFEKGVETRKQQQSTGVDYADKACEQFISAVKKASDSQHSGAIVARIACEFGQVYGMTFIREERQILQSEKTKNVDKLSTQNCNTCNDMKK